MNYLLIHTALVEGRESNHFISLYQYTINLLMSDKSLSVFVLTFNILVIFLNKMNRTLAFSTFNSILLAYVTAHYKTDLVLHTFEEWSIKEPFIKIYCFLISLTVSFFLQLSTDVFEFYILTLYILLLFFVSRDLAGIYISFSLVILYRYSARFRKMMFVVFISFYSSLILMVCIESLEIMHFKMMSIFIYKTYKEENILCLGVLMMANMIFYYFDTDKKKSLN